MQKQHVKRIYFAFENKTDAGFNEIIGKLLISTCVCLNIIYVIYDCGFIIIFINIGLDFTEFSEIDRKHKLMENGLVFKIYCHVLSLNIGYSHCEFLQDVVVVDISTSTARCQKLEWISAHLW